MWGNWLPNIQASLRLGGSWPDLGTEEYVGRQDVSIGHWLSLSLGSMPVSVLGMHKLSVPVLLELTEAHLQLDD